MPPEPQIPPAFGRRLRRERERRGWSLRKAGGKVGLNASTIMRAELGNDTMLINAVTLAALYGVTLSYLLAESACRTCDGSPPAGFICSECGQGAT